MPEGSQAATPIRASPQSRASLVPVRMAGVRSALRGEEVPYGCQRRPDVPAVGAAALRDVVLATAAAAERLARDSGELPRLEPPVTGRLGGDDDNRRLLRGA